MNTNEQDDKIISIEEAIRISKILCTVSEERIPIILDVFTKAGVTINGLDELEEWKALKDQAYIIDMDEFVAALTKDGMTVDNDVCLRPKEFEEICKRFNVKPSCAKRALHKKGYIRTAGCNGKTGYTVPVWFDGKAERFVVIKKKGAVADG